MVLLTIFFMLALFSTFFYVIGLRYLSFLPIAVLIFMLSHSLKNVFKGVQIEKLFEKGSLILIWLVTMVGISGILFFIGIKEISVYLDLLIFNLFLRVGSYVFEYKDGKLLFEVGTWMMVIVILGTALFGGGFYVFFQTFSILSCLMLGIYAFLQFVIGIFYPKDEKWIYEIFVLGIVAFGSSIIRMFYPQEWIMFAGLALFGLIFLGIFFVQGREMPAKQTTKISVRRILAGERIFKKLNVPEWKIVVYDLLENSPSRFPRVLEFINLGLLIFLLLFFFWGIFTSADIVLGIRYWAGIAIFLINIFLLKKIGYASDVSRFSMALIANFVLYSVLLISGSSIENILPFLIVWGFLCQIAVFYIDRINLTFFEEKDYQYRTIVTFIASICNIVLLFRLGLPTQFLFSVIFVYVGVELMLLYYITRFLQDRKEMIEKAEEEEKKILKELASSDIESE